MIYEWQLYGFMCRTRKDVQLVLHSDSELREYIKRIEKVKRITKDRTKKNHLKMIIEDLEILRKQL